MSEPLDHKRVEAKPFRCPYCGELPQLRVFGVSCCRCGAFDVNGVRDPLRGLLRYWIDNLRGVAITINAYLSSPSPVVPESARKYAAMIAAIDPRIEAGPGVQPEPATADSGKWCADRGSTYALDPRCNCACHIGSNVCRPIAPIAAPPDSPARKAAAEITRRIPCGDWAPDKATLEAIITEAYAPLEAELQRRREHMWACGNIDDNLTRQLNDMNKDREALRLEVERLRRERDLAIAHDGQAYPTAEAYEKVCAARAAWQARAEKAEAPIPMVLCCPQCTARHIDNGEFATKPHHTHPCQTCGFVWRPAVVATVGVQFLPGYKNAGPEVTDVANGAAQPNSPGLAATIPECPCCPDGCRDPHEFTEWTWVPIGCSTHPGCHREYRDRALKAIEAAKTITPEVRETVIAAIQSSARRGDVLPYARPYSLGAEALADRIIKIIDGKAASA